jgi:hypothetical protein
MRNLIALLLLLPLAALGQTKFYLSAAGNDGNPGTSASAPWLTINKLNAATLQPGDSVFFRAGDTFRGNIVVSQSGSPTGRIVYTSYGTGAKPIISGAVPLTNWTQHGDTFETQIASTVRNFFVNGVAQQIARYPNAHQYLWLDSARTSYFWDNALTSLDPSLVTGSRVCAHTAQWCWEISIVTGLSADTLRFSPNLTLAALDGYGYFLYDNIAHLDTAGEWKQLNQRLWYKPPAGQDPNLENCEAAVYNFGVQLDNDMCYITVDNLAFEKQGSHGVFFPNGGARYNVVSNCTFTHQYNHGVQDQGKYNEVTKSHFEDIGGIAVYVNTSGGNATIHHNTFRKIGMRPENGIGTQVNLSAVTLAFVDSCHVHHNDIDSAGYCGISADGSEHLVERNIIRHAMLWNNDGAALKAYGEPSHHSVFRNNFVSASEGTLEGTNNGDFITPGIYFDFRVHDNTVLENTVYDHAEKGIFQNAGNRYNTIRGNVVFGGNYLLDLNGSPAADSVIQEGFDIKQNVLFALDDQAYIIRQVDFSGNFAVGTIEGNYYFQPYNPNRYALRYVGFTPTPYTFAAWQATGNDLTTQSSFVSWPTTQNDARLFMNQTDARSR